MLNDIYLNNSIALVNVNTFKLMLPIIFHIKQRAPRNGCYGPGCHCCFCCSAGNVNPLSAW